MDFKKQSHAVYYTRYHIVVSTKYRRKILRKGVADYLKKVVKRIENKNPEIEIVEVNTDEDHIHLLVSIPPKESVSKIVGRIKGNTAYLMRKRFDFLDRVYWGTGGIWSIAYFVSTVGINEEVIRKYIEHQDREDRGQAKLEF